MKQTKKETKMLWDALREVDRTCEYCQSKNVELPYRIYVVEVKGGGRFEQFNFFCGNCFHHTNIKNIVCQCGSYNVSEIHNSSAEGYGGYNEWWVYHCFECGYAITRDYDNEFEGYLHKGIKNE